MRTHETALAGPEGIWLHPYGPNPPLILHLADGVGPALARVHQDSTGYLAAISYITDRATDPDGRPVRIAVTVNRYSQAIDLIRAGHRRTVLDPPAGWIVPALHATLAAGLN